MTEYSDKMKVLVVDDVPENLNVLSSVLVDAGYKVYPALNGGLALQALQQLVPDVILLDIKMPGLNGYEVCARIKQDERTEKIPVIFISALDETQDVLKAFSSGGVDYINKPFRKEEVLARVDAHARLSRYQRDLESNRDLLESMVEERTRELAEKERKLRQAQEQAHLGNWEIDLGTGVLECSDEVLRILGVANAKFAASYEAFLKLTHPKDRDLVDRVSREAVEQGSVRDVTFRVVRVNDGEVRHVHAHSEYVPDGDGAGRLIGTVQDVTGLVVAEQEGKRYLEKFRRSLEKTIVAVGATLEKRDPYTAGHQRRVSAIAEAIAVEMGLAWEQVEAIRLGGFIHDIGKIHIPAEILTRPGRLSEVEFSLIKQHPQEGWEILKDIEFPWPIAELVLQHHERMDGSGYPAGLRGDEVRLEARIIAVADVLEAMSSHRPYRPAMGLEAALLEIENGAGVLYDQQVVEACLRLFREKGYVFPDEKWA